VSPGEILADVQENWMLYCAMPLVAAGIGYVTKLVATREADAGSGRVHHSRGGARAQHSGQHRADSEIIFNYL